METFVVRIFVGDDGSTDGPRGVIEHVSTGSSAVFDGFGMLLDAIRRGLERARKDGRQRTGETIQKEAPG